MIAIFENLINDIMELRIITSGGINLAEIVADSPLIMNTQDAVELIMNCRYNDAERIIIKEHHLSPDFFNLKTGVAGDILQKFSTYQSRLAIIGDFSKFQSKSLKDFIFESNKGRRINFVSSLEEAKRCLAE